MNVDKFAQQIYSQIESLCQLGNAPECQEMLPIALTNLGIVSEELQLTVDELQRQNEELLATRTALELQVRRYQELFDFAPDGYIVIDKSGKIEEANRAAAELFNVPQRFLVGKPLIIFVAEDERQALYSKLMQLQQGQSLEWVVNLCPRNQEPIKVVLTVAIVTGNAGNNSKMQVCIRQVNAVQDQPCPEQIEQEETSNGDRRKYVYLKGELIPLKPQMIWQVDQGIVKLSTLSETGEEVVVGLAGPGMPFGVELTSLHTYQATALSQVQLLCYSFNELAASPLLAAQVLPRINQRLRQSEALLAIFGQRRVKDRFEQLLQLLKQEIGQPTERGIRLSVRFTHQELAEACSTTRVTVTRLLGKLQDEGKISMDAKNHIILKEQSLFDRLPARDIYTV
ncbi:PAS domain-containing protein [Gloeocapsopsis crepidinum LEGE 06123]|uniref:PAS domain-containing protein n=1 Tax=Gloeocapsopsis crepidinum LEGE 06123 TaxID=588587 RepID=A0ABR9ULQ7_9CHRO|nr:PAS domain-containing protein [Gloeocapsopsis crepidinum]MBE9189227.1 PAS domain-containing protein [Gloeocapsopsis crepidinum LEGE 06123]